MGFSACVIAHLMPHHTMPPYPQAHLNPSLVGFPACLIAHLEPSRCFIWLRWFVQIAPQFILLSVLKNNNHSHFWDWRNTHYQKYPTVDNRKKYFMTWSGSHTNEQQARRGRLSMEQLIWELVQLFKLVEEQWIIHWNQSRPFDKGYHHLIHLNQRMPFNKTKSSNGRISNPAQNSLSIP